MEDFPTGLSDRTFQQNKEQRPTYKSISNFLCALHKEHKQIPQTRVTSPLLLGKQKWSNSIAYVFMEHLHLGKSVEKGQSLLVQFTEDLGWDPCCDPKSISDPFLNLKIQISFSFKNPLNYWGFTTYSKHGAAIKSPLKEDDFIPT